MPITRRIFVSAPADRWLSPQQNGLKRSVIERIEAMGYMPEIFLDPSGRNSMVGAEAWTANRADEVARHCHGAILIGLPRWTFQSPEGPVLLPTEFSHYEGAIARTLGLPTLVLAQADLLPRVVFEQSFGGYVGTFPANADGRWLSSDQFTVPFGYWQTRLEARRDVFLGYSGQSFAVAVSLRDFLERDLDVTVLDWRRDFQPGRSILAEIEEARARCTIGIFLFTKDDELATAVAAGQAVPRDNVVFEAGYFISAKGKGRVLIVRETGAKMPADLGGDIYASFDERTDLSGVQKVIVKFLGGL
jgi:CAP12/Pycsar effector protein, TIR domain